MANSEEPGSTCRPEQRHFKTLWIICTIGTLGSISCRIQSPLRKTALPVVWERERAQSRFLDPIKALNEPEPPKGMKDAWEKFPVFKQVLNMVPKLVSTPPCQELVREGDEIDLSVYPIQTCWQEDAAPLITWPPGDYQRP
jgi:3-octaprenyl-4-hydroxybenzoate carboxy-lyase